MMAKINGLTKRLLMLYSQGHIASAGSHFQVYGVDKDRVNIVAGEDAECGLAYIEGSFKVHGEVGTDWCEMAEVAWHFNQDHDGCLYYVGSTETGIILKPSWREIKWMANYASRLLLHDARWSTEELMAWTLMVGGDWYNQLTYS